MSLATDLQSDFASIQDDFGVSTTVATKTISAVKNSVDKDIIYTEMSGKSVEYKFTLWYDTADFTAASISTPDVHDEIIVGGITYLVAKRTLDPLDTIAAFDMVEQYG